MTDAELEELERRAVLAREGLLDHGPEDVNRNLVMVSAPTVNVAINTLSSLISTIRELREENAQTKLGYDADIHALCEALWKREPGCEFVRLNYPQIATELEEQS